MTESNLLARNSEYVEPQSRMDLLPAYYWWMANRCRRFISGRVAELGCGIGNLIPHYIDKAQEIYAIDHDEKLLESLCERKVRFARARSDSVREVQLDLRGDWQSSLPTSCFDTILAMDVLEHFEDDATFVRKVANALKPGGRFIVKVPAQKHLYGLTDESSGHYRRYDESDLDSLCKSEFLKIKCYRFNKVAGFVYRFKNNKSSTLSGTFNSTSLRFINAAIPLLARIDNSLPGRGLSIIGIYEKR